MVQICKFVEAWQEKGKIKRERERERGKKKKTEKTNEIKRKTDLETRPITMVSRFSAMKL